MSRAALLLLAGLLALACGKYGPPVRASAQKPPEKKAPFAIPLPGAPQTPAQEAPAPVPPPELEEEPPPEGAP